VKKSKDVYEFSFNEDSSNKEKLCFSISRDEYLNLIENPLKIVKNKKNGFQKHLNVNKNKMKFLASKINDPEALK
jgi:hypothetical protein